ncbi:MAG: hypothetical protein H0W65_03705 [Sphingomonas sp.]|uniref:hypothetical protein n=1 Tax=Sphingomonas sp. TaxID=28214 RepID=UPI0017F11C68|nr:hypothetical protein [Sphingomonas sp.]MBA3666811.1 hypothetical protein [Sphingomonas sp.]
MFRKNTRKGTAALLAAAALGACTTTFAREGTSTEEANRDIAECRYEANKASPENPLIAFDLARQCLKLRGYTGK